MAIDHIIPELGALQCLPDLLLRPIRETDGVWVAFWRNTDLARQSFFDTAVVTPDSHRCWLAHKDPYDVIWLLIYQHQPVGMTGLHIDSIAHTGEYGRLFIDAAWQGQGLAALAEYSLLWAAFEYFNLASLWLDAFCANAAVIQLHHKTGWQDAGVDLPGHTHPRGPVLHQTYDRATWAGRRMLVQAKYNVSWSGWQEASR